MQLNLYPSDLLNLGFSVAEADEWIERLAFVGLLDASGMVQALSIFGDPVICPVSGSVLDWTHFGKRSIPGSQRGATAGWMQH